MSVYVDPIGEWGTSAAWRWNKSCHMFADTEDELHVIAQRIGLKRAWFQNSPSMPHYDLTESKRRQAIKAGAQEVEWKFMAEFMEERVRQLKAAVTEGGAT